MDAAKVRGLTLGQIDAITGLGIEEDIETKLGRQILESVRDQVAEAIEAGMLTDPARRAEAIHELADGLIPAYFRKQAQEYALIAAAWHQDLQEVEMDASAFQFGNHEYATVYAHDAVAVALYGAYRDAVRALVEWLEAEEEEGVDD